MREMILTNGNFLYVGRNLKSRVLKDANECEYVILGNAYVCNDINKDIEYCISNFKGSDINDLIYYWTGKFIIIRDDEIQTDAGGLMPLFYTNGKDWILSSSLALMKRIKNIKTVKEVSRQGINWQLLPNSLYEGISQLLCTQKINFVKGEIKVVFNPWIENMKFLTTSEKINIISTTLQNALHNIYKYSGKQIYIALTAGKDSRLVLASALSAGIKFKTYTFEHETMLYCDRVLPGKIAKDLSFEHVFLKREKFSKEKSDSYEYYTAGNCRGVDQMFYSYGVYDKLPEGCIIVRSGLFEAGQNYLRHVAASDYSGFKKGIQDYYVTSFENENQCNSFELWLKGVSENPIDFIDLRDRMYLEQRVGGWTSSIEQSLDITGRVSIQIANCRALLSVLLSASDEERKGLVLSYKTIETINPQLSKYPYNKITYMDKIMLVKRVLFTPSRLKRYIRKHFN